MTNKKRTIKHRIPGGVLVTLIALLAIFMAITVYTINIKNTMVREAQAMELKIVQLEDTYHKIYKEKSNQLLSTLDTVYGSSSATKVLFTNYGTWDSHSTNKTASTLTTSDFQTNAEGMYTYQGLIVLASANTTRLDRPLSAGFNSHELYEKLDFVLNNKEYQGIVLDVCGACFMVEGEDLQRYDIFTTSNIIGLKEGFIYKQLLKEGM